MSCTPSVRRAVLAAFALAASFSHLDAQSVIPDLRDPLNRFDYVIISPPGYLPAAQTLALRRSTRNHLAAGIAITDSIYSSFGNRTTPDSAIRNFIGFAVSSWTVPAPKYFLIAGNVNAVPSHREPGLTVVAEDSVMVDRWFVEQGTDAASPGRAVAALGRLPAWNIAGLYTMVSKISAYEDSPSQSWMRRAIEIADTMYAPLFESLGAAVNQALSPSWPDTVSVLIAPPSPEFLPLSGFLGLWGRGAAFVSFIGEMNWYQFGNSAYFTTWDVDSLASGSPLPVCLMLAGQRFERADTPAIAVNLLQSAGNGAIAVIAPSGGVYAVENGSFLASLGTALAARPSQSIGDAFLRTVNDSTSGDLTTRRQTLLGDPALVVRNGLLASIPPGGGTVPAGFVLQQNYPNPFNPTTTIRYGLPRQSFVKLAVFNTLGQQVALLVQEIQGPGYHEVRFDGSRLASGAYIYRIQAGAFVESKRLVLLR